MLDLIKKYRKAKAKAIQLMEDGRLSEYLLKLTEVQTLKLQLIEARA